METQDAAGCACSQNVGAQERIGSVVAGTAALVVALERRGWAGLSLALMGAGLLKRGFTGNCQLYSLLNVTTNDGKPHALTEPLTQRVKVQRTVTVNATPAKLYAFWRKLDNLPRFMDHLISVEQTGENRSHWVAKAPGNFQVAWDAQITEDTPDHKIAWKSLPGSDVVNEGSVTFTAAPGDRGTEVRVVLRYEALGGKVGQLFARLLGQEPTGQIADDLRRFKQVMEAGEIARVDGQPQGQKTAVGKILQGAGL